jgi:hypothetical protein
MDAGGCTVYSKFTLGIHIVLDVHWDAATATLAGDDKVHLWSKAILNANGTMLSGDQMSCGTTLPDINLNAVGEIAAGGKKVLIEIPFASWDAPSVPKFLQTGTLSGWSVGSDINMDPSVVLIGLTMTDPMGAWPDRKSIMGTDAEGDGKLGMTGVGRMGNGYVYPPTALTALLGSADKVYTASRTVVQLTGKTTSCDEQSGTATAKFFDNHVIGCHVYTKAECDDGQVDFIDSSRTVYVPKGGTFKSKKLPDNATCTDVRAALP